jgi:hypothetical protein
MSSEAELSDEKIQPENHSLTFLNQRQVNMIDEALAALGEYGELRLIVEKGRLRFLVTQRSFDALKWRPGSLREMAP